MSPRTLTRLLLFAYLYALGALCLLAVAAGHQLTRVCLGVGIAAIPIALWRSMAEWRAAQSRHDEEGALQQREARLRAIADGTAAGLMLMDLSGRIVQTNSTFAGMLGRSEDELEGQTAEPFTFRGDLTADAEQFQELTNGRLDTYQVEKRYLRPNDEVIWAHLTVSLVRDGSGAPQYAVAMVEDISKQKQEGVGLREIEELFRQTFDQAAIGVAHTDPDGRLMFVNKRLSEMTGYKRDELFGKKLSQLLQSDYADATRAALNQLAANQIQEHSSEARITRRDGTSLWVDLTMSMMRRESGAPRYGIVMIEDVTERRQAQEALRQSEERYRAITQTASDAIITVDERNRIVFANRAAGMIFGYPVDDLVGLPFAQLLDHDAEHSPSADIRYYIGRSDAATSAELVGRHQDGHPLSLEIAVSLSSIDGHAAYTGVIRDISERKRAEEARAELIALEEETRAMSEAAAVIQGVVDASPLPIVTVGLDGAVQSWNEAAAATFGWSEREVLGRPVPFTSAFESGELKARAQRGESLTNLEVQRRTKDGAMLDLYLSVAPVRKSGGTITSVMFVYADITDRKRIERELETARDQALESSRLKSEFLATMSHEIRTPMNGIIGTMELLRDTPLDTEQSEYVGIVDESAHALLTIINDILDFSKLEADKLVLDSVNFEPVAVVEGAAELLAAAARDKGLSLMTAIDPALPIELRGDSGRLRQVLLNLIGNAVKFTERGEIVVKATRESTNAEGTTVRFEVRDTGIGLSEAAIARLFQPFVQADGSTTRKYGGTGLGLAICKRLAEGMGGSIGVDSVEGQGATFWFTARFGIVTDAPAQLAQDRLQGARALVVDAHAGSRSALRPWLEAWGMQVQETDSAREAVHRLAMAGSAAYDVVVTEYNLPDMDGLQLERAVHAEPRTASLPMVLLTSADTRGQGEAAVHGGFAAYLTKPAKQGQLLAALLAAVAPGSEDQAGESARDTRLAHDDSLDATSILPPQPRAAPVPHESPVGLPSAAAQSQPAGERALVLLVEDNRNNQLMALRQLEKLGHDVHIVSNGLQAVKVLTTSERYDLVFMDCQMPEMDGYDATRAVRSAEVRNGRHIPIVAMTANAMGGDREACISAGMDDYIPKPITREVLRSALERWLPESPRRAAGREVALVG